MRYSLLELRREGRSWQVHLTLHRTDLASPFPGRSCLNIVELFFKLASALLHPSKKLEQLGGVQYAIEHLWYLRGLPLDSCDHDIPRNKLTEPVIDALCLHAQLGTQNAHPEYEGGATSLLRTPHLGHFDAHSYRSVYIIVFCYSHRTLSRTVRPVVERSHWMPPGRQSRCAHTFTLNQSQLGRRSLCSLSQDSNQEIITGTQESSLKKLFIPITLQRTWTLNLWTANSCDGFAQARTQRRNLLYDTRTLRRDNISKNPTILQGCYLMQVISKFHQVPATFTSSGCAPLSCSCSKVPTKSATSTS